MITTGPVLEKASKQYAAEFSNMCADLLGISKRELEEDILNTINYYNSSKDVRFNMAHPKELEERWYESLKTTPDYSIYSGVNMLPDMWACWKIYSREYLRAMVSEKTLPYIDKVTGDLATKSILSEVNVNSVLDLGCGIGYTTAALTQMFPNAKVYATNLPDTAQFKICESMASQFKFKLLTNVNEVDCKVDLVFASEYFEHFEDPTAHLDEVLKLNPDYLIIANAFSAKSVGHFDEYYHKGEAHTGKLYGRVFNSYLREQGFDKVVTNCYNNRPTYWKRKGI
jgi:SAM-dependent methyltransferase